MSVVDDIKARLDIVDVVSGYVALQKSGRNFKANCPFHNERTPSFIVNPERQSWRCFGACATGGDVFTFVMKAENLAFGDALKLLAQRAGVSLPERPASEEGDVLHRINQLAARFYQDVLASPQGREATRYLEKRGIRAEARDRFGLGLSPQGWDGLKSHLLSLGVDEEQAVRAGLLVKSDNGRTRDFFRGRLMFPIHDRSGQVAGFGARALDDSQPKYINTAQTPAFDKRGTLYGLHLAADAIRARSAGVIVEGYMDVIAAHQHGYTNVVASMGTALTEHQMSLLKPLAKDFVLALDADAAGQEAMQRALIDTWEKLLHQRVSTGRRSELYYREALSLRVAVLPEGLDPDDLVRQRPEEWERLVEHAVPLMDYLIPAVVSRFDISTGQGKSQAVEFLFPIIMSENAFDQDRYLNRLAEALGVTRRVLDDSVALLTSRRGARTTRRYSTPPEKADQPFAVKPDALIEDYTLALLLRSPELKEHVKESHVQMLRDTEIKELFTRWMGCATIDDLWKCVDASLRERLKSLTQKEMAPTDRRESEVALAQCLQRLERRHLQELQESLLAAEDSAGPPPRELEQEIVSVNTRLKELFAHKARPV